MMFKQIFVYNYVCVFLDKYSNAHVCYMCS